MITPVSLNPRPAPHDAAQKCTIHLQHRLTPSPPDLKQQFEVRLDEGLDTFVVVDGCPSVPEESKVKLVKFLCKKLSDVGRVSPDAVYMPVDEKTKMTQGYVCCVVTASA